MPRKPRKICRWPPCQRKTSGAYCDRHKDKEKAFAGSKAHPFYNHKIWRGSRPNKPFGQRGGLREKKLMETPYCEQCKENGIYKDITGRRAGVVDHKIRFQSAKSREEQWKLFTDWDNLQSLCTECHAIKTAKE